LLATSLSGIQTVDLRRHDEITFGQAVDLVGPDGDFGFSPLQQDIRMMALFLGDSADAVDEVESIFEIGEAEGAGDVVLVDHVPIRELMAEGVKLLAFEGRDASLAGDAVFGG